GRTADGRGARRGSARGRTAGRGSPRGRSARRGSGRRGGAGRRGRGRRGVDGRRRRLDHLGRLRRRGAPLGGRLGPALRAGGRALVATEEQPQDHGDAGRDEQEGEDPAATAALLGLLEDGLGRHLLGRGLGGGLGRRLGVLGPNLAGLLLGGGLRLGLGLL